MNSKRQCTKTKSQNSISAKGFGQKLSCTHPDINARFNELLILQLTVN